MKLIALANNKGHFQVDDADFAWLSTFKWHDSHGYATTWLTENGKRVKRRAHQLLMPRIIGLYVDHSNRDKRDNRRCNLRLVTKSQNNRNANPPRHNTSGYKGVTKHTQNNRWIAQISINHQTYYIGSYATAEEAAKARVDFEDRLAHRPHTIKPKGPLQRNNTTGTSGVYPSKLRSGVPIWKVQVSKNGKHKHLGTYPTLEEAVAARKAYAR